MYSAFKIVTFHNKLRHHHTMTEKEQNVNLAVIEVLLANQVTSGGGGGVELQNQLAGH